MRGLLLLLVPAYSLPQFEAYWESQESWSELEDLTNPWFIDLGDINVGPPGYLGGPSVINIAFADICVMSCQEDYPDEFCSKYPPEGIPAKPRTEEDWGTKFNKTSVLMTRGIHGLKAKGAKVNLSYGYEGLKPKGGGGDSSSSEDTLEAVRLAQRMARNVAEWDLDGVDIFTTGKNVGDFKGPGTASFHYHVFKNLRKELPIGKTISYTIMNPITFRYGDLWHPMEEVLAASHKFLDHITVEFAPASEDSVLNLLMDDMGIPASKIGWMMNYWFNDYYGWWGDADPDWNLERLQYAVDSIKDNGLRGLSVFSVNQENTNFRGDWLAKASEMLYL